VRKHRQARPRARPRTSSFSARSPQSVLAARDSERALARLKKREEGKKKKGPLIFPGRGNGFNIFHHVLRDDGGKGGGKKSRSVSPPDVVQFLPFHLSRFWARLSIARKGGKKGEREKGRRLDGRNGKELRSRGGKSGLHLHSFADNVRGAFAQAGTRKKGRKKERHRAAGNGQGRQTPPEQKPTSYVSDPVLRASDGTSTGEV